MLFRSNELTAQYEKLRRDAADTVGLNGQIELLKKENKDSVEALEKIKLEYSLLESEVMLHWFLAGAGVFFLAWGLGFALGRVQRKRKTRLY